MSALSPSVHQSARATAELEKLGVDSSHYQATIDDPIRRAVVAAAYRGEIEGVSVTPADWAAREMAISAELVKYGLPAFDDNKVECMSKGNVGLHDRFLPGDLTLQVLFPFFYNWNNTEDNPAVKLAHDPNKEWWRNDKSAESLPTMAGVLTCNYSQVMQPIDLAGRPYFLPMDEQVKLAKQMGGSGLTSAEQVTYLFIRSVVERRLPLWAAGSARCRNLYGSGYSLRVGWGAGYGFYVFRWVRSEQFWILGAVPEVFTALEA